MNQTSDRAPDLIDAPSTMQVTLVRPPAREQAPALAVAGEARIPSSGGIATQVPDTSVSRARTAEPDFVPRPRIPAAVPETGLTSAGRGDDRTQGLAQPSAASVAAALRRRAACRDLRPGAEPPPDCWPPDARTRELAARDPSPPRPERTGPAPSREFCPGSNLGTGCAGETSWKLFRRKF